MKFATSWHQVYVTSVKPVLSKNRETLFYLGCNKSSGLNGNDKLQVTNKIYEEFRSLKIKLIDSFTGIPVGDVCRYWGQGDRNQHMLVDRNGVCGEWANFFQEVISVQGIDSKLISVILEKKPHHPSEFTPFVFVLKEVKIAQGTTNEPARISIPDDQGNTRRAQTSWPNHAIVKVMDHYYDPSYGTAPCSNQIEWENNSINAIQGFWDGGANYWIPNNSNKEDVKFREL